MFGSEYVHRGRTLNAGVEGHPDEIFEGSRGAGRNAQGCRDRMQAIVSQFA